MRVVEAHSKYSKGSMFEGHSNLEKIEMGYGATQVGERMKRNINSQHKFEKTRGRARGTSDHGLLPVERASLILFFTTHPPVVIIIWGLS